MMYLKRGAKPDPQPVHLYHKASIDGLIQHVNGLQQLFSSDPYSSHQVDNWFNCYNCIHKEEHSPEISKLIQRSTIEPK